MCCASAFDFKNMVKILKRNGYGLVRKKGSHFIYSNGTRTISINKDLNMMVARRLIKENKLIV